MDYTKQKERAGGLATLVWLGSGIYLFLTKPGATLFSWTALGFLLVGAFAAAFVFGIVIYLLERGVAKIPVRIGGGPTASIAVGVRGLAWVLFLAEIGLVYLGASWTFDLIDHSHSAQITKFAQDRVHLNAAIAAFNEANQIDQYVQGGKESGPIDSTTEAKMIGLVEKGLADARAVRDDYLAYLDPELPQHFHDELIKGHELLVQGRKNSDVVTQVTAIGLLQSYYQGFLPKHVDGILQRMGEE
jgi:hypothetical protein